MVRRVSRRNSRSKRIKSKSLRRKSLRKRYLKRKRTLRRHKGGSEPIISCWDTIKKTTQECEYPIKDDEVASLGYKRNISTLSSTINNTKLLPCVNYENQGWHADCDDMWDINKYDIH